MSDVRPPEELDATAERLGIACLPTISAGDVDAGLLASVPLSFARANTILPMMELDGTIRVAISGPAALLALDELRLTFGKPVEAVLVPASILTDAINHAYAGMSGTAREVLQELEAEDLTTIATEFSDPKDLLDLGDEAPVIRLLNSILSEAVKERSSDIHIEPYERDLLVRFRIDGLLYEKLSPPKIIQEALISRVKIMAGLNIAEKRLPQDGRIRVRVAGRDVDIRVSIIPTFYGERAVLRLLDKKKGILSLADIGLGAEGVKIIERMLTRTSGIILVTGPTGSGKSTTLYASLNRVNSSEKNIITIEDPIEYQIKGIGQIQVNPKIELTFASGLRSILRQDPDIIMVGEIRDKETADMAVQAALTGHLVFSTLHTNDAASSIARLLELGVPNYLVNATLVGVLAQRLIRTLCPHCKAVGEPIDPVLWKELVNPWRSNIPDKVYKPVGCLECRNTGYMRRTGLIEMLVMTDAMRALVGQQGDIVKMRSQAARDGLRSLRLSGAQKIANGMTTMDEVLKAAPPFTT